MTNLDNEIYRVATFQNWPLNYPSALNFARAGLAYTGSGDAVRCYKCHCVISNWRENDIPLERHRLCSPTCPLVTSYSLPTHWLSSGSPISHPSDDLSKPPNSFPQPSLHDSSSRNLASATVQMPISNASSLRADDHQNGEHLKLESQRFRTFDSFPNDYVSRRDLAKAGFVFTGIGDCVKCVFCKNILKQWEPGDVPLEEHRKHFPRCPFLLGLNVGNVPDDRTMPVQSTRVLQPQQGVPAAAAALVGGGGGGEKSYNPLRNAVPFESRNSLNFDVKFSDVNQRLRSYENVPLPKGQERETLAEAGFYYVGPGDSVKCFQCGGVLKKWSEMDEPWIEHARWFPHCIFLLRAKGDKFINDVEQQFNRSGVVMESNFGNSSLAESSNEDTTPKTRIEEAEQEELTSLKQEFVPSGVSTFSGASSSAVNVWLPARITHPVEMPSSSPSSPSSSSTTLPSLSTTSLKPSKAANKEIGSVAKENERLKDGLLCKICMDEMANTVFLPCGHLLCCEHCAPAIADCPICRGIIKGTLKVYIS